MHNSVTTIAKYTFLEALRNRLFFIVLIGLICAFGLSKFIGELSVTERTQIEISMLSVSLRLFIVFIMGLFVTTSIVREFNDKGFELVLSHPVARSSYYLGKLLGFCLMSIILSVLVSIPLLLEVSVIPVFYWCLSLICELFIINALAIMCLFTFNNITLSFSAVVLFYLLSRLMDLIQLISESPILETNTISQALINYVLDGIAYLLPDLNSFTQTVWLVYGEVSVTDLLPVVVQTIIYLVLLSTIALFDLYRKEL
ncbi:MAG: ABC transporter permease [Proteobacteria bacterium]|nr:ABC transporter permease [Pseudomonadota bacterium]